MVSRLGYAIQHGPATRLTVDGFALPAGLLHTLVRAHGLEVEGWLDQPALESAVEQHYRSLGYLAVEASVDPPVFSGRSATLPVHVAEGRPFQIASVAVHGAVARSEAELRQVFGINAGSAYVPSALEPARRKVEVGYLREGFNDVRVRAALSALSQRGAVAEEGAGRGARRGSMLLEWPARACGRIRQLGTSSAAMSAATSARSGILTMVASG